MIMASFEVTRGLLSNSALEISYSIESLFILSVAYLLLNADHVQDM